MTRKLSRLWVLMLLALPVALLLDGCGDSDDPTPPPPVVLEGACCFADDSCQVLAQDACVAATGVWQGAGSDCDPNPCGAVPPTGSISFTFDGTGYTSNICLANYFPVEDETGIIAGDGVSWTFTLDFPGNSTGSFSATSASLTLGPLDVYELEAIDVTVSAYGAVGGAITGTFSGTLVNLLDPGDVKAISGGTFSAERLLDID